MAFSGNGGSVLLGTSGETALGEVKGFTLEMTAELMDASAIGADWREKITGLKGWSATIEAHFDAADAGQAEIEAAEKINVALLAIPLDAEPVITDFTGTGVVRSVSVSVAHDQVVAATFQIDGDGELVIGDGA